MATISNQKTAKPIDLNLLSWWRRLTEPPADIQDRDLRRRMRFLAALLVFVLPFTAITFVLSHLSSGKTITSDPLIAPAIIILGMLAFAYGMSRNEKYFFYASIITLFTTGLGAWASSAVAPADFETILVFLAWTVLLASLLLSVRATVVVSIVSCLSMLVLPLVVEEITYLAVINVLIFVVFMAALIVISAAIRQDNLRQIEAQSVSLANSLKQLEEASKLKSQFLATMSHELRTPLNAIIGFSEVMMMGLAGEIPPEGKRTTERIHVNSQRLLQLIDDLLDISKIEAGRLELVYRPFKLSEFATNVDSTVKPQAIGKGLEYITEIDPNLPITMLGDTQRLEQIIFNLVYNAIKFTDKGSITVRYNKLDSNEWTIQVTDTGVGIPSHTQEYIFDKFRQADNSTQRVYKGAGLGLAIVRELALLMNGSVKVSSKLEVGSVFTVTLPIVIPEGAAIR